MATGPMGFAPLERGGPGDYSGGTVMVGASELSAEFLYRGKWSRQRSLAIAIEAGKQLVDAAMSYSSGRPGPEVVTGRYHDTFYYEVAETGLTASVYAGSDADFAMRLEFGFDNEDAVGRSYNQPPLPHWRPAADAVLPQFEAEMVAIADFDVIPGNA